MSSDKYEYLVGGEVFTKQSILIINSKEKMLLSNKVNLTDSANLRLTSFSSFRFKAIGQEYLFCSEGGILLLNLR